MALYANAVICEDKLKEYGRAINLYQELINRFSRHKLSHEAKRRWSRKGEQRRNIFMRSAQTLCKFALNSHQLQ